MKKFPNTPNLLTFLRVLLTPVFVTLFFAGGSYSQFLSLITFGFASLTDKYDGYFARKKESITSVGKFFDPLADKILTSSALISFAIKGLVETWLVGIILSREFIITTLRIYSVYSGRRVTTLRLAKWKTGVQLIAILFVLAFVNIKTAFLKFDLPFLSNILSYYLLNGPIAMATLLTVISGFLYLFNTNKSQAKI